MPTFVPVRAAARLVPVVAIIAALVASLLGSSAASATVPLTRYAGKDVAATAVEISAATFAPGVAVAYVSSPDIGNALPAAAAAGASGGPVLLTAKGLLPDSVTAELSRLQPERIVAVGGTGFISDAVLSALESYATTVTRDDGGDHIGTAAAVSAAAFAPGVPVAYVARDGDQPTMFAAAAAAGAQGGPLLLTNQTTLSSETASELARLRPARIVVAGGTSAVTDEVVTALGAYASENVSRQAGADSSATGAAIAKATYPDGADLAFIGGDAKIADGMTGAAAAAARHLPLLVTDGRSADVATTIELARESPQGVVILGGPRTVSNSVATALAGSIVPDPVPTPVPTPPPPPPTPGTASSRPYDADSPWNTPIAADVAIDPLSRVFMTAIIDNALPLTSDPDQYAIPVYLYDEATPLQTVHLSGFFSSYDGGDASRVGYGSKPTISAVPIPADAVQSAGSDGQIVIWDPASGTEYSFWQFARTNSGTYTATNGYRYHTTTGYNGRFADGLAGRGAGTPYFAGLVRKWEIDAGHVDHALAFAYDSPSGEFRYPASKSDGGGFGGITGSDLPEGTRLQLDPALTEADFSAWGLSPAAKTIARALQTYGMYVIDHSGSSKIYLEDRLTAKWGSDISRDLVRGIPWTAFRVVAAPAAP